MTIPTLPFGDMELVASMIGTPIFMLILSFLAGLMAGKQEHDDAIVNNNPRWQNNTLYDWLEDGMYGLVGGVISLGIGIPILLIPIGGYAGRKILPKMADKFIERNEK